MKVVLCYGDSNTWGYDPATKGRFNRDERWTGVLRQALGDGYVVIEEGLNGRTTVWDDPIEGYKNGKEYLIPCLASHDPIDLVIIMLGTNDLKQRFSVPAADVASSAGVLVKIVQQSEAGPNSAAPQVLLLAPPPFAKMTEFAEMFSGGPQKSLGFSKQFSQTAQDYGCAYLDTAEVIVSSDLDGIHFEAAEHHKLGRAVAAFIQDDLSL